MGCGCGKKKNPYNPLLPDTPKTTTNPAEWGPPLWTILHCFAEKIGSSGSQVLDTDHARIMEFLITLLPIVLPCQTCQEHAREYIRTTPPKGWPSLQGEPLRSAVRTWLFTFHNHVRAQNGQPITINTAEECAQHYSNCEIIPCYFNDITADITLAVRHGWVRIDSWKRWVIQYNKLKLLLGIK